MKLRDWLTLGVGFALGTYAASWGIAQGVKDQPERWLLIAYKAQVAKTKKTQRALRELQVFQRREEFKAGDFVQGRPN